MGLGVPVLQEAVDVAVEGAEVGEVWDPQGLPCEDAEPLFDLVQP